MKHSLKKITKNTLLDHYITVLNPANIVMDKAEMDLNSSERIVWVANALKTRDVKQIHKAYMSTNNTHIQSGFGSEQPYSLKCKG